MGSIRVLINSIPKEEIGVLMGEGTMESLMTPLSKKSYITNESPLLDGEEVLPVAPANAARDVTLTLWVQGSDTMDYLSKYARFCKMLEGGFVKVWTSIQADVEYNLGYVSCTQINQGLAMGKFVVKMREFDPSKRQVSQATKTKAKELYNIDIE